MPQPSRVVVVFVASPSDMAQEREKLEEVIDELNTSWSQHLGITLDLVRWETHGVPGVGDDPQDALNKSLPDNIEIFVGLMWGRYGTATGRAGSGTEEEFGRALARYRADPNSIRIMFYFKDAPIAPSEIDLDQLSRVQNFKSSLGEKGILYWPFNSLDEFERQLRMHLTRQAQYFQRQPNDTIPKPRNQNVVAKAVSEGVDEPGLLDHLDGLETNIASLTEIAGRIAAETKNIGQRIAKRTDEINASTATPRRPQVTRSKARSLIDRVALDMNIYVTRLKGEIPLFDQQLHACVSAAAQIALITSESASANSQSKETVEQLTELGASIDEAIEGMASFRDSVLRVPRMTSNLNRAKREAAAVLQDILSSMESARDLIAETKLTVGPVMDHE